MKKFSLDFLRTSGVVLFSVVACLIVSLMGYGIYAFVQETTTKLPFNLIEFLYQKKSLGGFELEIKFINNFIFYIIIAILCMTVIIVALKYIKSTRNPLYALLIILSILIAIFSKNMLSQSAPFQEISESGINQLMEKKERAIIYVGRETCPDCIEYKPKLTTFLKKEKKHIRYFDVSGSEEEIVAYRKYYNKLGIEGVPAIIIIEKGQIKSIYYGDKTPNKIEKEILEF